MSSPLKISEIIQLVDGQCLGPEQSKIITGVATLKDATANDISFFGNPKYLPAFLQSNAGAILIPASHESELVKLSHSKNTQSQTQVLISVENPTLIISRLIDHFAPPEMEYHPGIASTAIIGRNVELGKNITIQDYVVIEDNVTLGDYSIIGAHSFIGHSSKIGSRCRFYPRVTLREGSQIGNRVIIHSGAVIGSDGFGFELENGNHVKLPQKGIVQIDDDVEVGANTTIDRARFGKTHIGEGTKIDNLVMIGHNVVIGPKCLIVAQVGISGSTQLGQYVTIGGQAGLTGHIKINDKALIGAQTGVSKDLPEGSVVWGTPAEPLENIKRRRIYINRLPKMMEEFKKLKQELAELKARNLVCE